MPIKGAFGDEVLSMPQGYVIDGHLSNEIRERIKSYGYPMRRSANVWLRSTVNRWEKEAEEILGTEQILLLVLPDDDGSGWSMGYVAISDLMTDDPESLLQEASEALDLGNEKLANFKRLAYLAVTGYTDTK